MKQIDYILENEQEVLTFLKSKYPLYHLSNIFFRDIQYGIQTMLDRKNMSVGYADAEKIARAFVAQLEKKKILSPIDKQSWVVNHPEFKKPAVKPTAPAKPAAKPAASAPAAARSAATPGGARPSLPPLSRPATGAAKPGGLPPISRPATGTASTSKPGGLPPLNRPATGASGAPKPGSLPPIKSTPAPKPASQEAQLPAQAELPAPAAVIPTTEGPKQVSTAPPAAKPVTPGERKPLPPLKSSTPAGKK